MSDHAARVEEIRAIANRDEALPRDTLILLDALDNLESDLAESKAERARYGDTMTSKLSEAEADLAEAKKKHADRTVEHLDMLGAAQTKHAAERKLREAAERKLAETAQGRFVEGYAKAEADLTTLRADVEVVRDDIDKYCLGRMSKTPQRKTKEGWRDDLTKAIEGKK